MTILCATDFSPSAIGALQVAGRLAERLKTTLHVVHALTFPSGMQVDQRPALLESTQKAVSAQAAVASAGSPVAIESSVDVGLPTEVFLERTQRTTYELMVVGSGGTGGKGLGHVADSLAQKTRLPTLVVRDPQPFLEWLSGARALRIAVGIDGGESSSAAWTWANALSAAGAVELIGLGVYWPLAEFQRLGFLGLRSALDGSPEVEKVLRRDFERRLVPGNSSITLMPWIGRPSDQLCGLAADARADLLVVGSHRRSGLERLWKGSVSRGVVHDAASSVALVPSMPGTRVARFDTVLVPIDFTERDACAIVDAVACAQPGARMFLLYVMTPGSPPPMRSPHDVFDVDRQPMQPLRDRMTALANVAVAQRPVHLETLLAESLDIAEAISQAAERLDADVICMGTHNEGQLHRAVIGSIATAVLAKSTRPLLLSRPSAA